MPTNTYTPLATITLTGTDSEIVFSSIPATYRDLILIISAKNSVTPTNIYVRFNSDTGSNYSVVFMKGNGSSTSSGGGSDVYIPIGVAYATAGNFDLTTLQIMDYSATDKHKTALSRTGNSYGEGTVARAGRWANTAAINRIALTLDSNAFDIGSSFSLYGVIA